MNTFEILKACGFECTTAVMGDTVKVTNIDALFSKVYPRNKLKVKTVIEDYGVERYRDGQDSIETDY